MTKSIRCRIWKKRRSRNASSEPAAIGAKRPRCSGSAPARCCARFSHTNWKSHGGPTTTLPQVMIHPVRNYGCFGGILFGRERRHISVGLVIEVALVSVYRDDAHGRPG